MTESVKLRKSRFLERKDGKRIAGCRPETAEGAGAEDARNGGNIRLLLHMAEGGKLRPAPIAAQQSCCFVVEPKRIDQHMIEQSQFILGGVGIVGTAAGHRHFFADAADQVGFCLNEIRQIGVC